MNRYVCILLSERSLDEAIPGAIYSGTMHKMCVAMRGAVSELNSDKLSCCTMNFLSESYFRWA
jgi:hypothetical protein